MIEGPKQRTQRSFLLTMAKLSGSVQPELRARVASFAPKMIATLALVFLASGALRSGLAHIYSKGAEGYLGDEGLLLLIVGIGCFGLIGRKLGLGGLWLVCYTSVPMGLVWSTHEYMIALANMDTRAGSEGLALIIITMLSPVITAALICTFAFFITPEDPPRAITKVSSKALSTFATLPLVLFLFGIVVVWGAETAILSINLDASLVLLGALGLGLYRRHVYSRPFAEFSVEDYARALMDGGKITAFFGAATCALFYIPFSRLGEPSSLGPALALSIMCVLYGCLVYTTAVILGCQSADRENQDRLRLDLWHLGESYAFILLASLAPYSLFDFMG